MTPIASNDWLSIREASRLLGVHVGTVREWADAGILPSYRTAGGHRRFSTSDLHKFLDQRNSSKDARALTEQALYRVRDELCAHPHGDWFQTATPLNEKERARHRELGQHLLACVVAFVQEPDQRESLLDEGRRVAREYGRMLAARDFSAGNAARATIHFRQLILKSVLETHLGARTRDEEDARLFQRVSGFLDEILLAIVEAYP